MIESNPYRIALDRYEWGSSSDMLNQATVHLCIGTQNNRVEEKYLVGAEQITDYVFGKNATGYSFLTGFGSKQANVSAPLFF
ncbi:MAG: glycoside hydrolase family 9 protein [Flavobacteriaceae bacterium]|nr:glycoside hydrolase family 9 protein [Flavobacteriaceae bacterium]